MLVIQINFQFHPHSIQPTVLSIALIEKKQGQTANKTAVYKKKDKETNRQTAENKETNRQTNKYTKRIFFLQKKTFIFLSFPSKATSFYTKAQIQLQKNLLTLKDDFYRQTM